MSTPSVASAYNQALAHAKLLALEVLIERAKSGDLRESRLAASQILRAAPLKDDPPDHADARASAPHMAPQPPTWPVSPAPTPTPPSFEPAPAPSSPEPLFPAIPRLPPSQVIPRSAVTRPVASLRAQAIAALQAAAGAPPPPPGSGSSPPPSSAPASFVLPQHEPKKMAM